jgi:hypothetical protein
VQAATGRTNIGTSVTGYRQRFSLNDMFAASCIEAGEEEEEEEEEEETTIN